MEQQPLRQPARIPARPIEHFMIATEARLIAQPHHPQRLRHRAFAGRQHRARDQDQNVVPDRGREAGPEHREPDVQNRRDEGEIGRHGGLRAIRCHRRFGIDSASRRKSLRKGTTRAIGPGYHSLHD